MKRKAKNIIVILLAIALGVFSTKYYEIEINILNAKMWQTLSISFAYTAIIYFVFSLFNVKTMDKKYNLFFILAFIGGILFGISYLVTLFT